LVGLLLRRRHDDVVLAATPLSLTSADRASASPAADAGDIGLGRGDARLSASAGRNLLPTLRRSVNGDDDDEPRRDSEQIRQRSTECSTAVIIYSYI